jgi:DNA repair exonuclease SbcCD ATPase subunit
MGITASKAITHFEDLLKFSDIVSLPHVQDYLNQRTAEKAQLEGGIKEIAVKKSVLENEVTEAQKCRNMILEEKRKDTEEMSSYLDAKQELGKHGISLNEDITKFANTVKCIAQYGYNPKLVLAEFKNIGYLEDKLRALQTAVGEKEKKIAELNQSNDELEQRSNYLERVIKLHLEELPAHSDLANIGVGPKHLRVLYNLMVNITNSNEIPYWLAADKFFEDIGTQYDAKLGLESQIENQKSEIQLLNDEREKHLKILKNQHLVGHVVTKLLQTDLPVDDILKMGQSYLSLLKRTYSVEDLSKGMIKAIDMVTAPSSSTATTPTGTTKTSRDDKFTEILTRTRNELSELHFNNQPAV